MKKALALVFALIIVVSLAACGGKTDNNTNTQTEKAVNQNTEPAASNVQATQNQNTSSASVDVDTSSLSPVNDIEVNMNSYIDKQDNKAYLVFTSKSNTTRDLILEGEFLSSSDSSSLGKFKQMIYGVEPGVTIAQELICDTPITMSQAGTFRYDFYNAPSASSYKSVDKDIKIDTKQETGKAVVTLTNEGSTAVSSFECFGFFFKSQVWNKTVKQSGTSIQPGETITVELPYAGNYDEVKVYFHGYGV